MRLNSSDMRQRISLLAGACALGAAVLTSGCHKQRETVPAERLPSATVRVVTVADKKYLAEEEVIGTARAKLRATIEAKITGRVEQMPISLGQTVKSGELLALLETREIQARLEQAMAVRDQARQDLKRFAALVKQSAVTQQEFDAVQTRARVAEASVTEAESLLGYAKVTAPFAGVVSRKLAEVGDLATPGRPLLELENPGALRFEADVPEDLIDRVQMNDKLTVRMAASTNVIAGAVCEIAPVADPSSRTVLVKLDLPNIPGLRNGQFGRVAIPVAEVHALRVPATAVVVRGQMELVIVATNRQAQLRLIKTGKHLGDAVEVVSGLSPGEQIVSEGAAQLKDGQPLEMKP
jgi:membrane fusion protein (multidrug efflux system)